MKPNVHVWPTPNQRESSLRFYLKLYAPYMLWPMVGIGPPEVKVRRKMEKGKHKTPELISQNFLLVKLDV